MIELNAVALRYADGPDILHDISFAMQAGDLRFLTGASGSGKSTLLRLLFLALKPTSGTAHVFGADVAIQSPRAKAHLRRKLGVVFQDFRLLDHMTLSENVALPLRAAGLKPESYAGDVRDLLDWVGLKARAHEMPHQLSGGEQQRVAIARAVVTKPELILADEPTGNVDPGMARRLLHLFQELNRLGTTVLLATHDVQLIAQAKGRAMHLARGTLREL